MLKYLFLVVSVSMESYCIAQSNLSEFKAFEAKGKVYLSWEMTIGNTCNGIKIFHAIDSIQFEHIGEISGTCGSKVENVRYTFEHSDPKLNRINYYKLELGSLGFSDIISIELFDYKNGYQIRPHPVDKLTKIYFKNDRKLHSLKLYNLQGTLINFLETYEERFEFSTANLPTGIYLFIIEEIEHHTRITGSLSVIH